MTDAKYDRIMGILREGHAGSVDVGKVNEHVMLHGADNLHYGDFIGMLVSGDLGMHAPSFRGQRIYANAE